VIESRDPAPARAAAAFAERLGCPASYWIIALGVGVSTVTAVGFYLGPWIAAALGVVTAAGIVIALGWYGSLSVRVDAAGLRVGPALLEWEYLGEPHPLDAAATRRRLGADADVRAFVAARPYLREAVEVPVRDAADPHPYWLVCTRQPGRLAAALRAGRGPGAGE